MRGRASDSRLRAALVMAAVATAYFASAKLGLALAFEHSSITAIWPPTGVALAAILLLGFRVWPAIALGALVTNLTTGDAPAAAAVGIAAGNTLEALAGGYLLKKVGFRSSMERMRDVGALVVLAAALSTGISASIGVFSLWASGAIAPEGLGSAWRTWWLGDLGGALLVAPPILVFGSRPKLSGGRKRAAEAFAFAVILFAASIVALSSEGPIAYPIFPLLFIIALRFGPPGATLAGLVASGFAVGFTAADAGPFVGGSPDEALLRAQLFVAVASTTALFVAAVRSERREAERALALLAERERQLADAQKVAHVGSWEWDVVNDVVTWSDELYRIFSVDPESFDADYESFLELVHPDDRERVDAEIKAGFEGPGSFRFEHRVLRRDGEVRWMEANGRLIRDPSGAPVKMVGTGQDITSFKLAEQRFRQLLEFAPDAIIGMDPTGRIELANSQVTQLFGYERDELIGKPLDLLVPSRFREAHALHRADYVKDPRTRPMGAGLELFALRRDGTEFPCEISLSSIPTERGRIAVAAVRDVSERKETEAEADRLKSEFFALVSHELRTPLTSIRGYIDLLAEPELGYVAETGREFLDVVKRNSERLDRLVQDLLLVSQLEAGGFEIDRGTIEVEKLRSHIEDQFGPEAESAGVLLATDAEDLPPFEGDPHRLAQAADNLVANAIKFTEEDGRVDISIHAEDGECVIEVADTGCGIEPEDVEHLFDRFYRSRDAARDQVPGVGLGLSIVKAITESHGGRVEVESERGEGSTLRLVLPMRSAENSAPATLERTL